jgi:hypothetical protein
MGDNGTMAMGLSSVRGAREARDRPGVVVVGLKGHAIECRINAEDPRQNFRPSPGVIREWALPAGVGDGRIRVDTHVRAGYEVPPYYDSLISAWRTDSGCPAATRICSRTRSKPFVAFSCGCDPPSSMLSEVDRRCSLGATETEMSQR